MAAELHGIKTIARRLDLSERRVQQLTQEGIIPKAERGRYVLTDAVHGYIRFLRHKTLKADSQDTQTNVISLDEARRRKLSAEAELAELQLESERKNLVAAEQVEKVWAEIVGSVRSKMLAVPSNISPLVIGENKIPVVKEIIENAILEGLNELSNERLKFKNDPAKDRGTDLETDGTATQVDNKPVGRQRKKAKSGS